MTFCEWFGLALAIAVIGGRIWIWYVCREKPGEDPWYSDMT